MKCLDDAFLDSREVHFIVVSQHLKCDTCGLRNALKDGGSGGFREYIQPVRGKAKKYTTVEQTPPDSLTCKASMNL